MSTTEPPKADAVQIEHAEKVETLQSRCMSIVRIATPATATSILSFANITITLMFVGQMLGVNTLAQYCVGVTVFNIVGWSVGVGLASALDTLVTQAHGRADSRSEICDCLQRALLINYVVCVPIIIMFFASKSILVFVFGEELGVGAAIVLRCATPSLLVQTTFLILVRMLQAQRHTTLPLYCNIAGTIACPVVCYFLVPKGLCATVCAVTISNGVALLCIMGFCIWHPQIALHQSRWPSPNLLDWGRMKDHLRVAFPAMCASCSEWWAFEVLPVVAAQISPQAVAALNICINILVIAFSVPFGFSQAIAVLVGNELGAFQPRSAYFYFSFIMRAILVSASLMAILLFFFGLRWASLYTTDAETLQMVDTTLPVMISFHFADATQTVMQGAFRGVGRQDEVAKVIVLTLWLIGVPGAAIFALLLGFGFPGILIGFSVGIFTELPLLVRYVRKWDWNELAATAAKRSPSERLDGV